MIKKKPNKSFLAISQLYELFQRKFRCFSKCTFRAEYYSLRWQARILFSKMASLQLQLAQEDEDLEELFVNGKTAMVHRNLPSKSKLSQWCQKNNINTPIYEVRGFHLESGKSVSYGQTSK